MADLLLVTASPMVSGDVLRLKSFEAYDMRLLTLIQLNTYVLVICTYLHCRHELITHELKSFSLGWRALVIGSH